MIDGPVVLVLAILSVESSYATGVERPARGVPDTVQFSVADFSAWRVKTFAIDHDIHVHRLGAKDVRAPISLDLAEKNIRKTYGDVLKTFLVLRFEAISDQEAVAKILAEQKLSGSLEVARDGFVFYNPDRGVYKSKTKPAKQLI